MGRVGVFNLAKHSQKDFFFQREWNFSEEKRAEKRTRRRERGRKGRKGRAMASLMVSSLLGKYFTFFFKNFQKDDFQIDFFRGRG